MGDCNLDGKYDILKDDMRTDNIFREDASRIIHDAMVREAGRLHFMHIVPDTLQEWQAMQQKLIALIKEKAGSFPQPRDPDIEIHGDVIKCNGYNLSKVSYRSREGIRVTANLYTPEGKGPFPGVLNLHGHLAGGKAHRQVQARGHVLASSGFAVLTVDAFGSGERTTNSGVDEYHGAGIGSTLFNIGETLLGMQLYDNMRAVDILSSLPNVDKDNIGVTGASGGGNQTMWLSALDKRIKASVPVVSVGTFESYVGSNNCVCEVLPEGLTFMEEWAVLAIIAPRPLLMLNSLQDIPCFSVREMLRSFSSAREIYRMYGVSERLFYQAIDLPHGYWPEMLGYMLGWFKRWLKNEGEGRICELPGYTTLDERKCLCFPEAERPAEVCSITEYVKPRARRLAIGHLDSEYSRDDKIEQMKDIFKIREPEVMPFERTADSGKERSTFVIESEPGIILPCVLKNALSEKRINVVIHPGGKRAAVEEKLCLQLFKGGESLFFADLRGTGETCFEKPEPGGLQNPFHRYFRSAFWLGRTPLGDWTTDILAITNYLGSAYPEKSTVIYAFYETGISALCAAAIDRKIAVKAIGIPSSYAKGDSIVSHSMSVYVPGILKWGDVSMAAALAGGSPELINPKEMSGKACDKDACNLLDEEIDRVAGRMGISWRGKVSFSEIK